MNEGESYLSRVYNKAKDSVGKLVANKDAAAAGALVGVRMCSVRPGACVGVFLLPLHDTSYDTSRHATHAPVRFC